MLRSLGYNRLLTSMRCLLLTLSLCALSCSTLWADDNRYAVGVAEVDITPSYPIRLNGFGFRREESEGVTEHIFARALAIGADDDKPVVLITVDSLGVRRPMVDEVARRLKEQAGIDRDRVVVTFTHSHTTPKLRNVSETVFSAPIPAEHQERIDRYDRELTDLLEKVALAALADRKLALLDWGVGSVGFAKNRRTEGGPIDHSLPMLVVRTTDTRQIRAVYVTYACHCVTLSNNKISGDWAGFAAKLIERNHPGAVALVSIGCGSDSNPSSGVVGDNAGVAAEQGSEIAQEVDRLLKGALRPISGPISATLRDIPLPLKTLPSRDDLEALATNDSPEGFNAKFQLAKLDRGEPLQNSIDYPIQTWTFGDSLSMVFLGGEVCVDYSLRLNQELDATKIWLHGYSNDFCCYVPSERLLREGGYGGGAEVVYFGLPATLEGGLEDKIVNEVHRQVPKQFHRSVTKRGGQFQPTDAESALRAIRTHNRLMIELVAAEPLIANPVAIDFGVDGSVWIVEMTDYGREVEDDFEQTGSVKNLQDTDDDGTFDKSTTFVTGLRFPTDVKVWSKGVIVCDAPDVIYLEDSDGDGKADVRKVLLTGFATHNPQARVNSLRWGLDNWMYGSCGLFGGKSIRSFNGQEIEIGGQDFRFKPDTGEIETVTGCSQQGRAQDDWGNWFGCDSGTICEHYPLADNYMRRNPFVASPAPEVICTGGDSNRLYPVGETVLFKESGPPGRPTSVCGLTIYRDELLGAEFRGNVFVGEPVNQLVHRRVLVPEGVTYAGIRAEDESDREMAASTDNWFRPVQVRTGPDGCLWIVDMSRYVIEHPRLIPSETLDKIDPMAGRTAGRIFRVRPRDQTPRRTIRLDHLNTTGLVDALDSPNGPQRDLAHQILVQRGKASAVPLLERLVAESQRPEARLQAICVLDGLNAMHETTLLAALKDAHPGVRRHAVRISERLLNGSPAITAAVLQLADDDDPQVRCQVAYSLGELRNPRAAAALAKIAWRSPDDPYLVAAVLSTANTSNAADLARELIAQCPNSANQPIVSDGLNVLVTKFGDQDSRMATFRFLSDRAADGGSVSALKAVAKFLESLSSEQYSNLAEDQESKSSLERLIATARECIQNPDATDQRKLVAVRLLSRTNTNDGDIADTVVELLGPQSSPTVQHAAVRVLASQDTELAAESLFSNWSSYSPTIRAHVLDAVFSRSELLPPLIAEVKAGRIKPSQLDTQQRQRLLSHSNADIRAAAANAFVGAIDPNRKQVLESFAIAARTEGDASRGKTVFQKHCASCHQLEGQGHKVGPDLAAVTSRTPSAFLESIFDPNRAVDERYQSYTALLDDGRVFTGILSSETTNSVTLLEQAGKKHTVLRNTIEEFENSGISLMPEGFEKDLTATDVSDLISYLMVQGVPPKQFKGNEPTLVHADQDGVYWLLAANGAIYGHEIVFEPALQNVGNWHGRQDYVSWDVTVDQASSVDVYVNWASADGTEGNTAIVDVAGTPLHFMVRSTGGFENYESIKIGQAQLATGANRIAVRPAGNLVARNLMDLRGVYLVPAEEGSRRAEAGAPPGLKIDDAATKIVGLVRRTRVNTPAEYKRIPDIWRVAVEAGRRNKRDEVIRILEVAIPRGNEPLRHWQAVALGGGIVNGLSQIGCSPRGRVLQLLEGNASLLADWNRAIQLAAAMADDESVPVPTRYDALRMLGADSFETSGARLTKYLNPSVHEELEMGAVSSLSDMEDPTATEAIITAISQCRASNKTLAVEALLRTDVRIASLKAAVMEHRIPDDALSTEQWALVRKATDALTSKQADSAAQAELTK